MAINRVEIKDFLVFKGEFAIDFCLGVNVFIGGNGTGKTTLMKCLYDLKESYVRDSTSDGKNLFVDLDNDVKELFLEIETEAGKQEREWGIAFIEKKARNFVYIPEKDILEHAKGLLSFIEQKPTGFSKIYRDTLINAQDIPINNQTVKQKKIGEIITGIIGGHIEWVQSEGSFYTVRTDGMRIPFAIEASGFKKLGFLGLLVASGQLEPGTILFWDEPENSLNPEIIPVLVDILLELSRSGVQIFIATHSEILASYFAVNRKKGDKVLFISLYKNGDFIKTDLSDRFDLLVPNNLLLEPVKLYEKQLEKGLGGNVG